jgi:phage shock protein E
MSINIEEAMKQKKCSIVDVRTPAEFNGGHVAGSVNIPLQELSDRMHEITILKTPLILCCASGNRSGIAAKMLEQAGIECVNGGSWLDVNYYQSQTV